MFTGIITETGVVEARQPHFTVHARPSFLRKLRRGGSVAVDGACLTIVSKSRHFFSADLMEETLRRTTLRDLSRGALVNLELPTTPTSFLSGHIVQGHVDGVGALASIVRKENNRILKFSLPPALSRYVVEKGSIAINGIALTVIEAGKNYCTVGIIPHTWENTSFRTMKVGARMNIEVDVLAKYAGVQRSDLKNSPRSDLKPSDIRIGIIGSSFRKDVTSELEKRCVKTLKRRGVKAGNIDVFRVPGSMEIPLAAKKLAKKGTYDALIVFGAVVKGKTYHFEQIANECARGCMDVSLHYEIPVVFEVLAVYDIKDALERATRKKENKGVEAAETALSMIKLMSV